MLRGVAALCHIPGCSQDCGSNYSTGSQHQANADLVSSASFLSYGHQPFTASRGASFHAPGSGSPDGELLSRLRAVALGRLVEMACAGSLAGAAHPPWPKRVSSIDVAAQQP